MPEPPTWPARLKMRPQALVTLLVGCVAIVALLLYRGGAFAAPQPGDQTLAVRSHLGTIQPTTTVSGASGPHSSAGAYALGPEASAVVRAARSQVGGHYATYGDTPRTGFSCVGLVHWSFAQVGVSVPESAPALAVAFPRVAGATPDGAHLLPGDILLFQDTAWAGYSHASIYAGNGMMVSADSYQNGIRLEPFNTSYWTQHWAGAVRVPALLHDDPTP